MKKIKKTNKNILLLLLLSCFSCLLSSKKDKQYLSELTKIANLQKEVNNISIQKRIEALKNDVLQVATLKKMLTLYKKEGITGKLPLKNKINLYDNNKEHAIITEDKLDKSTIDPLKKYFLAYYKEMLEQLIELQLINKEINTLESNAIITSVEKALTTDDIANEYKTNKINKSVKLKKELIFITLAGQKMTTDNLTLDLSEYSKDSLIKYFFKHQKEKLLALELEKVINDINQTSQDAIKNMKTTIAKEGEEESKTVLDNLAKICLDSLEKINSIKSTFYTKKNIRHHEKIDSLIEKITKEMLELSKEKSSEPSSSETKIRLGT